MRWGRAVAYTCYAALAVALASGGLACESGSHTVGPPAPTGPERTLPHGAGTGSPLATVTSVAPRTGTEGSRVTIGGTGFIVVQTVCFGTASSPDYRVNGSGTQITAVVPPGSGTEPVAVITLAGVSAVTPDDAFTYRTPTAAGGATSAPSPASPCAAISPESSP
jgi:hypothetical protein